MTINDKLFLTTEQCRQADRFAIERLAIPGIVLMENAGRGAARILIDQQPAAVAICCGTGNNGGDGFVIARHLVNAGVQSRVIVIGSPDRIHGDARTNLEIIQRLQVPIEFIDVFPADFNSRIRTVNGRDVDWIVDALLGTGVQGEPRQPIGAVIEAMNASKARKMAVDIPSGLDGDTGIASSTTVIASITTTFVARKTGFRNESAQAYLGQVEVVDIGINPMFITQSGDVDR